MEISAKVTSRQLLSWLSLSASIFIVIAIFLILTTSTDRTGSGMVLGGLVFGAVVHFYLFLIPIVGLCLDVYLFQGRRARKCTFAEYTIGLSTSLLLYVLMFAMFLRIDMIG